MTTQLVAGVTSTVVTIRLFTNEDGLSILHLFDTTRRKEIPAPNLPAGIIGWFEWHKKNGELGFGMESARATYDTYSLDIKTSKFERWTESETGGINTQEFSLPEVVRWKTFDDKMISGGLYYKPPAKFSGKRPVIIDIHGGPEGQARPWFRAANNYFVNELASQLFSPTCAAQPVTGKLLLAPRLATIYHMREILPI
jgi:dipeptidyl aminopeptidase/acylaminoacyl peptidase